MHQWACVRVLLCFPLLFSARNMERKKWKAWSRAAHSYYIISSFKALITCLKSVIFFKCNTRSENLSSNPKFSGRMLFYFWSNINGQNRDNAPYDMVFVVCVCLCVCVRLLWTRVSSGRWLSMYEYVYILYDANMCFSFAYSSIGQSRIRLTFIVRSGMLQAQAWHQNQKGYNDICATLKLDFRAMLSVLWACIEIGIEQKYTTSVRGSFGVFWFYISHVVRVLLFAMLFARGVELKYLHFILSIRCIYSLICFVANWWVYAI